MERCACFRLWDVYRSALTSPVGILGVLAAAVLVRGREPHRCVTACRARGPVLAGRAVRFGFSFRAFREARQTGGARELSVTHGYGLKDFLSFEVGGATFAVLETRPARDKKEAYRPGWDLGASGVLDMPRSSPSKLTCDTGLTHG